MKRFVFELQAFLAAVQFLTRVPVPLLAAVPAEQFGPMFRRSPVYYPLVGGLIGVFTGAAFELGCRVWAVPLAAILALAAEAFLTGAFHEDAVADFCDAFGGGWTRDKILEILRDSRIGSFGAVGLMLALAARCGGMMELPAESRWWAIIAAGALGRWAILPAMAWVPPVPNRPGLAKDVAERLTIGAVLIGTVCLLPGLIPWATVVGGRAVIAWLGTGLVVVILSRYVRKKIGGISGDVLGTICYVSQTVVLLVAAARL